MSGIEHEHQMAGSQTQDTDVRTSRTIDLQVRLDRMGAAIADGHNPEDETILWQMCERLNVYEALLREALIWAPRMVSWDSKTREWSDLGNRIEKALNGDWECNEGLTRVTE